MHIIIAQLSININIYTSFKLYIVLYHLVFLSFKKYVSVLFIRFFFIKKISISQIFISSLWRLFINKYLVSLSTEQSPDKVLDILILVDLNLYSTGIADDVEVLNQEAVNQNTQRYQTSTDDDLANTWEVGTTLIHRSEYAVQTVENNAQNSEPCIGQQTASGFSQWTNDNADRNDDTKEHLQAVHIALESSLEYITPQIHREQIVNLHQEIYQHDTSTYTSQLQHNLMRNLMTISGSCQGSLYADHSRSYKERGHKEVDWQELAPPQWEHLLLHNQEQTTQR